MKSRYGLAAALALVILGTFAWTAWRWMASTENRAETSLASPPIKLTWYHHFREEGARKWLEIGTSQYMKDHPNVTVEVISDDGSKYGDTMHNLAAVEQMPDIYMTDNIQTLEEYIDAGYAMNLTGNAVLEGIDPKLLSGVKGRDGNVWAVPFDRNGVGVFYNREAFERAGIRETPDTWQEFIEDCRILAKAGIQPIAAGYQDMWTLNLDLQPDIIASGIDRPNWIEDIEAGKASFAEDRGNLVSVLNRLVERYPYSGNNPFGTSWNDALEMLANGEAAMIINGTWTVDGIRSFKPDADIGMFAFPSSERSDEAKFAMKTTGGFVVNPRSRHAENALDLIRYFISPAMTKVFQDNKKGISIAADIPLDFDPAYEELDKNYFQTGKLLDYSEFFPDFVNVELGAAFRNEIISLLNDPQHDVGKCIASLDSAFDRIRPRVAAEGR